MLTLPSSSRILSYLGLRALSGSSNPESRHLPATNLSVKSREIAIKLTSEKKEDGVVNFLCSLLVWLFLSYSFRRGCILQTDCILEPKCISHRSFFSFSRRKRHYTLYFEGSSLSLSDVTCLIHKKMNLKNKEHNIHCESLFICYIPNKTLFRDSKVIGMRP